MKKINLLLKAVIFDMDGVITNTMPDHFWAWKRVFSDEGIHVTHDDIYSREGEKGMISVRELFSKYGKRCSPAKRKFILENKEKLFKTLVKQRFIPGSWSFLAYLKKNRFELGLVTGTSRDELHKILPKNIYELFSVSVTGTDVRHGKPHPEPYLKALKSLRIRPQDAVVLENAPFGIQSAKSAGLKCFALETSLSREFLKEADQIFSSIKELRTRVNFIFNGYETKKNSAVI